MLTPMAGSWLTASRRRRSSSWHRGRQDPNAQTIARVLAIPSKRDDKADICGRGGTRQSTVTALTGRGAPT
jgi:hypothetical protein